MRYHYFLLPNTYSNGYGKTMICNHPVYDFCTLYKINNKGLAVVQQRFANKHTYWDSLDPSLADDIYLNKKFLEVFHERASDPDENGLYPTVTVRQLMWALRMKPLPKQRWETTFDRRAI